MQLFDGRRVKLQYGISSHDAKLSKNMKKYKHKKKNKRQFAGINLEDDSSSSSEESSDASGSSSIADSDGQLRR